MFRVLQVVKQWVMNYGDVVDDIEFSALLRNFTAPLPSFGGKCSDVPAEDELLSDIRLFFLSTVCIGFY